jgi:hypothetical protein
MWDIFKTKPVLSEEDRDFQHACYEWLLKHFGGSGFYEETVLVLPTEKFSPTKVDSAEEAAETTFAQVKKYAGMEEWPCILRSQEEDPNLVVAPTVVVQNTEHNPLGTFSANENREVTITYNPKLTADPIQMIATFAHELSHYLTGTASEPPPGGWDNWEFATDICASFLGFGIFLANSAFSFQQYTTADSQGWETSRSGYLSEAEHSYSLALFLNLKGISLERALKYCDTNIKTNLKQAQKEIGGSSIIDQLRSVKHQP